MARLRTLDEELACVPSLRREDVQVIREWAKKQPHLPNLDDLPEDAVSVLIAMFIKRRYNSVERAKETLDNYFTIRDLMPVICQNRSVRSPEVQSFLSISYNSVMDKRDSEGNIVSFHGILDPDSKKYCCDAGIKLIYMMLESWCYENGSSGAPGVTIVFDQRNFSLSHMALLSLTTLKCVNHYNKDCSPISIKNIYIIYTTNIIQTMLSFVQPVLKGELFKSIKTFSAEQMNEFYKYVPREAVPDEIGGTAGSFEELQKKTIKLLERNEEIFQKYDSVHINESKRVGPQKDANAMFGLEGSFKKLNVD